VKQTLEEVVKGIMNGIFSILVVIGIVPIIYSGFYSVFLVVLLSPFDVHLNIKSLLAFFIFAFEIHMLQLHVDMTK
jgi:hypothetical protein